VQLIPTIQLEHLSRDQRRAFVIADNRLTENAHWNELLLGQELKILSESELDFSPEVTGFETAEIDLFIENLSPVGEGERELADDLPEPSPIQVSRAGDMWQLGKHRVLCGDALEERSYSRLLGDERAAVVFADPLHHVPIDGHVRGSGKSRHREFAIASAEMSEAEFTAFLTRACAQLARYSRDGSLHFISVSTGHTPVSSSWPASRPIPS
jgi:hypothetical protein